MTHDGDQPPTSPAEGIAPERRDVASERTGAEPGPPPRDRPAEPEDHRQPSDERGVEDVVERDHPLS